MNQTTYQPHARCQSQKFNGQAAIPVNGTCLWSERIHPLYEGIAEVRLIPSGEFQIWHHYGEPCMAWPDEFTPAQPTLSEAIRVVRGYQKSITDLAA